MRAFICPYLFKTSLTVGPTWISSSLKEGSIADITFCSLAMLANPSQSVAKYLVIRVESFLKAHLLQQFVAWLQTSAVLTNWESVAYLQ